MFEAAHHTGQINADAIESGVGLVDKCAENAKVIYYAKFSIDKDQPCGKYRIEAHAINGGPDVTFVNYIWVECFTFMNLDFTKVIWENINPGEQGDAEGDDVWDDSISDVIDTLSHTPPNGATVHNGGNHGMSIYVHFSEMLQICQQEDINNNVAGCSNGKVAGDPFDNAAGNGIRNFDLCFGKADEERSAALNIKCVGSDGPLDPNTGIPSDAIPASVWTLFGPGTVANPNDPPGGDLTPNSNGHQVLCANEMGKLDLSIHPGNIPTGTYAGQVDIMFYEPHNPAGQNTGHDDCFGDQESHDTGDGFNGRGPF
jgi:hypothetical protein